MMINRKILIFFVISIMLLPILSNLNIIPVKATPDNPFITNLGTQIDSFEDLSGWVLGDGDSVVADVVNFEEGSQAMKLVMVGGIATYVTKTVSLDLSSATNIVFWVYVYEKTYFTSLSIYFSTTTNFAKYFKVRITDQYSFREGWNCVSLLPSDFTNVGDDSWGGTIVRIRFRAELASDSSSVSIDDLRYNLVSSPVVFITFDDGWGENYNTAKPILDDNNQNAVSFVIIDKIDTLNYETSANLNEYYLSGWDVSSHTYTHPDLTVGQSDADLNIELHFSHTFLEESYADTASYFAYPFGKYNDTVLTYVKADYRMARSLLNDIYEGPMDFSHDMQYLIKGMVITNNTSVGTVEDRIDRLIQQGGYTALVFHRIIDSSANYETAFLTSDFQVISDYLKLKQDAGQLTVMTFNDYYEDFYPFAWTDTTTDTSTSTYGTTITTCSTAVETTETSSITTTTTETALWQHIILGDPTTTTTVYDSTTTSDGTLTVSSTCTTISTETTSCRTTTILTETFTSTWYSSTTSVTSTQEYGTIISQTGTTTGTYVITINGPRSIITWTWTIPFSTTRTDTQSITTSGLGTIQVTGTACTTRLWTSQPSLVILSSSTVKVTSYYLTTSCSTSTSVYSTNTTTSSTLCSTYQTCTTTCVTTTSDGTLTLSSTCTTTSTETTSCITTTILTETFTSAWYSTTSSVCTTQGYGTTISQTGTTTGTYVITINGPRSIITWTWTIPFSTTRTDTQSITTSGLVTISVIGTTCTTRLWTSLPSSVILSSSTVKVTSYYLITSCASSTYITSTTTCSTSIETFNTCTTTCSTSIETSNTCTTTCSTYSSTYETCTTTCATSIDTTSTTSCSTISSIDTTSTTTCSTSTTIISTSTTTCSTSTSVDTTCTSTCSTSTSINTTCTTTSKTVVTSTETSCSTTTSINTTCTSTCSTSTSVDTTSTTTCSTTSSTTNTYTTTCSTTIISSETCTTTCTTSQTTYQTSTTTCTTEDTTITSMITTCKTVTTSIGGTTTTTTTKTTGIIVANQGWSILIVPILIFSGLILLIVMRRKR